MPKLAARCTDTWCTWRLVLLTGLALTAYALAVLLGHAAALWGIGTCGCGPAICWRPGYSSCYSLVCEKVARLPLLHHIAGPAIQRAFAGSLCAGCGWSQRKRGYGTISMVANTKFLLCAAQAVCACNQAIDAAASEIA